jgi:hypothetical protein
MIRDPSDGSVREPAKVEHQPKPLAQKVIDAGAPVLNTTTSGLPAASARDADRHERSRQWLKEYRSKSVTINPKIKTNQD